METWVVGVAVVLLLLGAVTAATPAVGGHVPTNDGDAQPATGVDTQRAPTGEQHAVPGEPTSAELVPLSSANRAVGRSSSPERNRVNLSYTYRRLPDRQDVVEVTMRAPATPGIDRVGFEFPEDATVVETENVVQNDSVYEWTGEEPAEIVYHLRIDWSYAGNARDSWVLLEHLPPTIRPETAVETNERITLAGTGYIGNKTMVLGAHEVHRRQADGQTIDVVVPGNLSLRYSPRRTVNALANVSRSLTIGARDEVVHAFATPQIQTEATILVQDGFALDGSTMLLDADTELAAWIHEYVHTRQAFSNAENLRWLTEGSARYYEWLLAAESGYAGWGGLRGVFARARSDDSVLAEPDTWGGESNYAKGAFVLGAIDRAIRTATDGKRTLEDALRRINGKDSAPTLETFVRAVRDVGGSDAAATAERYVTTSAVPDYGSVTSGFEAVYGFAAPRIRERVVGLSASTATRTRPLNRTFRRIPLALTETVRLTVQVNNTGGARGLGAVTPRLSTGRLGGDYIDTTWVGWVGSNESVTKTVTHRFNRPGTYDVTWNGNQYDVRVAPARGTASVAGLNVTRGRTDDGRVAIDVTVRNEGDRSTFAFLPVTLDGNRVSTTALVLEGGETRTVTLRVDVPVSGSATITVGTASTTVDLSGASQPTTTEPITTDPTTEPSPPQTTVSDRETTPTETNVDTPGIGLSVPLVLAALLGIVGLWWWTNRRRS